MLNNHGSLHPSETMLILKCTDGKEIGKIPALSSNVNAYLTEMARAHPGMTVDYVRDEDADLLSGLFGGGLL